MRATGGWNPDGFYIKRSSWVANQITRLIAEPATNVGSLQFIVNINQWDWEYPPPSGDIVTDFTDIDRERIHFDGLPEDLETRLDVEVNQSGQGDEDFKSTRAIWNIEFDFKKVIDNRRSKTYVFDEFDELVPRSEYENSGDSGDPVTYEIQGDMIEGDAHRTEIEDTVMNRSQVGTSDTNPEDVCTDCGETLENDDAAFCPYCGTEL